MATNATRQNAAPSNFSDILGIPYGNVALAAALGRSLWITFNDSGVVLGSVNTYANSFTVDISGAGDVRIRADSRDPFTAGSFVIGTSQDATNVFFATSFIGSTSQARLMFWDLLSQPATPLQMQALIVTFP